MSANLRTVTGAPMTSQGLEAPFRPALTFQGTPGRFLLDQIRMVDKARLVRKLGALTPQTHQKLVKVFQEMFAVWCVRATNGPWLAKLQTDLEECH